MSSTPAQRAVGLPGFPPSLLIHSTNYRNLALVFLSRVQKQDQEIIGSGWWSFGGIWILVVGYRDGVGALLRRGVRGEVCLPFNVRVADMEIGVTTAAAGTASDADCP